MFAQESPPLYVLQETMRLALKICLWGVSLFFLGQIVVGASLGVIFFMWVMVEQLAETLGWFPVVGSIIVIVPLASLYILRGRIFPKRRKA
jgi:hypothetical protein